MLLAPHVGCGEFFFCLKKPYTCAMKLPAWMIWLTFGLVALGDTFFLLGAIRRTYRPLINLPPLPAGPVRYIALTFDDGPYGEPTSQILDILKSKGVPATFFVVGKNVEKYPDLLKREYAEGHTIGNHSYDHARLNLLASDQFRGNVSNAEAAIVRAIGVHPALFRAPYGLITKSMRAELKKEGFSYVGWNDDPDDWDFPHEPADKIVPKVLKGAHPNKIILLHDGRDFHIGYPRGNTVAALPQIIDRLRMKGYTFVTVDQLLRIPAYK